MDEYKSLVKRVLSKQAVDIWRKLGWNQEKMAESLFITPRAYGDLERGKYFFSAPTLMSLIRLMDEQELLEFQRSFCEEVRNIKEEQKN